MSEIYQNYAARFLASYNECPPGCEHDTIVVFNGQRANSELTCMFSGLPSCRFLEHDNSGYDIGAFQFASRSSSCDMIVFLGASTWFNRGGWLVRMSQAFNQCGDAQYGAMGNRGDLKVKVWPHIRTTAFWMRPSLMNNYPKIVKRPDQRHPFEHGSSCFTSWVTKQGLKSLVVTWNHIFEWQNWDDDPNGFQRGDQSSLIAGDHLCERPYYPNGACQHSSAQCSPWAFNRCWGCLS